MAGPTENSRESAQLSAAKQALLELRLRRRRERGGDRAGPRRRPGGGPFPQSSAQRRLWLLDQLHPGLFAYNSGRVMRIRGPLDPDALDVALTGIVERHDVLRTALGCAGGDAVQQIHAAVPIRTERIDLTSASDPESEARRLARDALRRPFDLGAGLLLRARLLRTAAEEHILVLVLHHAASDEVSKGIIFSELAERYEAARLGRRPSLPSLPLRYADYASWEGERDADGEAQEGLRWWQAELAGAPIELELPHDRPRPAVSSFAGARLTETLPAPDLRALRSLARAHGVSLFTVLLAGFDVLLSRLCGTEDIVVGAPVSGRVHEGVAEIVGPFGNTVVLRTSLDGDPTFRELLHRVREAVTGALAHQEVPFERLVEALARGRDLSIPPLVQVLFNFIEHPSAEVPQLSGLELTPLDIDPGATKVDLALVASVRGEELRLLWEYSSELFDRSTISALSERLRRVLVAACAAPEEPIGALPVLSAQELASATDALAATAAPIPISCVHEIVARHARERPDAPAVRCGEDTLSYRELDEHARALAGGLIAAGVSAGSVVGLRLARSTGLLAAMLGVHAAGCAYLPLDPALPPARRAAMLEDSGAAVVVVDAGASPEAGADCIELSRPDPPRVAQREPLPAVPADAAAYVIYTSGSTGRPKGVVVEHRQLLNLLESVRRRPGIAIDDVLLAITSLSFDIAALELLAPLLVGASVVISEDGVAGDPDQLAALIRASGATIVQATPSTWRMLLDGGWEGRHSLRALCGGEPLAPALADALRPRVAELWNMYGPTETTIWSTCWRVEDERETVPIGEPLANTACYVLDAAGRPVPRGVVGELCIGGAGVTRGYHRRPELQAAHFVADPFQPEARMYRTGDRVRVRADGALLFVGREDRQVKLRGARIELGEIEATIGRAPGVNEVAVVLREFGSGDVGLVAYLSGEVDLDLLREFAGRELPAVMIPSVWMVLAKMPRTPNGKLDRARLPAPEPERGRAGAAAPRGELERRLAAVYSEILGVEAITRDEDFFALGGHSLTAARLVARVNAELGVRIPLRAIFAAPTVAALAALVERETMASAAIGMPRPPALGARRGSHRVGAWALGNPEALAAILGAASAEEPSAASPDGDQDVLVFPASSQQRRVWFLERLERADGLYAVPLCLRIDGRLPSERLARALDALAAHHEVLRTTLVEHDGAPMQIVHPPAPFALAHAAAADEARALELLRAEIGRPFDLAEGPLARALLVAVGSECQLLAIVLHHAVADGWSLGLLADELTELLAGRRPPHSPTAAQYGDYALWQQQWLQGPALDRELAWWRTALADAPTVLELPLDHPRPAVSRHCGERHVGWLGPELLERIDRFAVERRATLFMTLLAAVGVLLARHSGQSDLVLGTPVSGREQPELEAIVGYLANTLLIRTRLADDPSFGDAVERVKQVTLDALAHADMPFDRLVEELSPDRDLSRNPLFQVLVALQDDRAPVPALDGASVSLLDIDRGSARFDLSVSFARRDGRLRVAWEYSTELFERTTVECFDRQLRRLLESALGAPGLPISRLELMSEEDHREAREILDASVPCSATTPVHELVAARAAERTGEVAVSCAGREITYGELDARANQLAHALIAEGVGPGALVGLLLDRSIELIVAIHGVLRAGGAYVPLDPAYPVERLAFMIDDAAVRIVVTRGASDGELRVAPAKVVRVDDPAHARRPATSPGPRAGLDDLAYVIYTSGSTGRPKGVMIGHRGLAALLDAMSRHPGLAQDETMLGLTTPAFDLSVPDLHLPLVQGARLALATAEQAGDPRALAQIIERERVTVMQATPATWRMLLDDGWAPSRPMRIVIGGEAVPVDLARRLRDLTDEAWNFYGPTEATVWSTCWRIEGEIENDVPIGRPLRGTRLAVLDPAGLEVPVGAVGALYIGGVGVARGYLRRPAHRRTFRRRPRAGIGDALPHR